MIKEFNYYLNNNLVRKSTPDKGEATSLMEKANGRLLFSINSRDLNNNTAPYVFEDVYECLREAAQSLMSLKGYKPYSHEALISFLKEKFSFPDQHINSLNRFRILKNKSVYGGEKISLETCKESLHLLKTFLPQLKKEFNKLIRK